jgi:NAD-dependent oxidoreductase involved in siderophore biosynthesis
VLKADPIFAATSFQAASTLNSDNARAWYDQVPNADAGSSHILAGSPTTWTKFIDAVQADGKPFANLEIHSLGEMIAGAEHGMSMASVWGSQGRAMGQFVQTSATSRRRRSTAGLMAGSRPLPADSSEPTPARPPPTGLSPPTATSTSTESPPGNS